MTIDTARCEHGTWRLPECRVCFPPKCEACKGTGLACTEPAPSAGVSESRIHFLTEVAQRRREYDYLGPWTDYIAICDELLSARSRIAELSRQLEQAEAVRSDEAFGGALSDELYKKRIAELEAGISKWASECGGCGGTGQKLSGLEGEYAYSCAECADIRALLPKESGPEREECEK